MTKEHADNAPQPQDEQAQQKQTQQPEDQQADVKQQVESSTEQVMEDSALEQVDLTIQVEQLEKDLQASQAKVAEQQDTVIRARAEVDNVRRRAAQDVEKAHKFALEKFSSELLAVVDNLERSLEMSDRNNEAIKPMIEGVELTLKSLNTALEKHGVAQINPVGELFNPDHHQAMSMQESAEHPANTILAVMQKGYLLNERLIRPAMVVVSRAPEASVDTQA